MQDFSYLLKDKKSKKYILKSFVSADSFLDGLFNYMYNMINERQELSNIYISNFCAYVSYFSKCLTDIEALANISKRCDQVKNSLNKEQGRIYNSLSMMIKDILNDLNYDSRLETIALGKTIDEIIDNNNPIIFDLLSNSKIAKFRYHDGELLIDKIYKKFVLLLQSKEIYNESLEYLKHVIFVILVNNKSRIAKMITDLDDLKKRLHSKEQNAYLMSLKNELYLIKDGSLPGKDKEKSIKIIERYYDIHTEFSSLALAEAKNLKTVRTNGIKTVDGFSFENDVIKDFRNKKIITIDSHFKSAFDDALSFEKTSYGYLLGIYITDVSSFVDVNSSLGLHARERCESIYFSESNKKTITMFPKDISFDFFSLNSHTDKQVVAYLFKFSDNYDLIGREFTNAIINVDNNYTFEDIDKLRLDDINYDMIYNLMKLTDNLKKQYNDTYHKVKEKIKNKNHDNNGSMIVSSLAVFLNSYIAQLFKKYDYPMIYRVNESISLDNFNNASLDKFVNSYSKSYYSSIPKSHIINGECYCHITNPIRNYPSFINQHLFETLFLDWLTIDEKNKFITYWHELLPYLVDEINRKMNMNDHYVKIIKNIK